MLAWFFWITPLSLALLTFKLLLYTCGLMADSHVVKVSHYHAADGISVGNIFRVEIDISNQTISFVELVLIIKIAR